MRKMKRLLAAGLATIMACSMLTGCGGGSSDKKASIFPVVIPRICTSPLSSFNKKAPAPVTVHVALYGR